MIPLVARGIASLAGRLIARNPRLGKKIFELIKKPKGITVFRGEHFRLPGDASKASVAKMFDNLSSLPYPGLRKQAMGRWFSTDLRTARSYAGVPRFNWLGTAYKPGYIQKLTLSEKEARVARKLANRLHGIKTGGIHSEGGLGNLFVVPKKATKKIKKDELRTFINNLYKMIGKYKNSERNGSNSG